MWNQKDQDGARKLLTEHSDKIAAAVLEEWWELSEHLYIKYNDGYLNTTAGLAQAVFYPAWWLEKVGYTKARPVMKNPVHRSNHVNRRQAGMAIRHRPQRFQIFRGLNNPRYCPDSGRTRILQSIISPDLMISNFPAREDTMFE